MRALLLLLLPVSALALPPYATEGTPSILPEADPFVWEVTAPVPRATVRLVRDGETIREWAMHGEALAADHVDDTCQPGDHYYYLAVELHAPWREHPSNVAVAQGPHAWCSPVWVLSRR